LIKLADGGTAFFDEVAELCLPLQAKLLRFLEDRTFRRVGGTRDIAVDVRIIAATNVKLEEAVANGRFRSDLYFRLRIVPLLLIPLRERKEDTPILARYFIDHFNKKFRKHFEGLTAGALEEIQIYSWPGNVRELKNAIERVMLLEKGPWIDSGMLIPPEFKAVPPPTPIPSPDQDLRLDRVELIYWSRDSNAPGEISAVQPNCLESPVTPYGIGFRSTESDWRRGCWSRTTPSETLAVLNCDSGVLKGHYPFVFSSEMP
jgi:two-component system response regulator AtoC